MNLTVLSEYGIDYEKGIARCLNDKDFYEQVLKMFLEDDSFLRAEKAYLAGDNTMLFNCMHELKGVCGNAEITTLYNAVCPIVEALRNGKSSDEVPVMFEKAKAEYSKAIEGINAAVAD